MLEIRPKAERLAALRQRITESFVTACVLARDPSGWPGPAQKRLDAVGDLLEEASNLLTEILTPESD